MPIDIDDLCDELNEIKNESLVKLACKSYLEWAYLRGENEPVAIRFQYLYDPIIQMFARGGRIRLYKGELAYGWAVRPKIVTTELSSVEPEDISDSALDKLDIDWKETMS
ncbi:hypothetical protein D3C78_1096770 [compost metagenome]